MNPKPPELEPTQQPRGPAAAFPDDLALVRATLGGDARAVDAFVERLACVPRYLRARNRRWGNVLSEHELCDLVQDVMTVLWRRRESYLGEGPLEGWACGTSLLQFYARVRGAGARVPSELDPESLAEPAREPLDPSDRERILAALDALPPGERRVIRLKHFQDLSFTEIGHALDMSPNTAKTSYYRGLGALRRELLSMQGGEEAR